MQAATPSPAILETILGRLAILFLTGAGGDLSAARQAAQQMLANYHPETEDELRLAAEIISFGFHALEALSQAAEPTMSLNQKLRLRGSAVSLSRESHKSQRKLDQLQNARRLGAESPSGTIPQPRPEPVRPKVDKALQLIADTREIMAQANTDSGELTWTQAYQKRQAAKRIAANLAKNRATVATPPAPVQAL